MTTASLWACVVLAGIFQLASGNVELSSGVPDQASLSFLGDPEPLFLTPYINACKYEEGRNKSLVGLFKLSYDLNAYSGYITVNNTTNSNLFFLFVEAKVNASSAPLMLWTPGGPGLSSLFSLLLQNGPLAFNGTGLIPRDLTIQKEMSVIYLDAPVGAGFSFTNSLDGYPKKLEDVTKDIKEFLTQFLQLFPQYQNQEFYAGGDSYGARYSVALAHEMLNGTTKLGLNFQGVIGGVPFLGPIYDIADSGDFLYQVSMLNETGLQIFKYQFSQIKNWTSQNSSVALHLLNDAILYAQPANLFNNLTLYNSHASSLYTERPLIMLYCFGFVNSTLFKTAIHAGENTSLIYPDPYLLNSFIGDWLVDISEQVEFVLNRTRVLLYSGQMDTLFPAANQEAYFQTLNWTYAEEYRNASRRLWKPYDGHYGAAGFTKSAKNFTSAVVLGMGHYAGFDKPGEIYHLIMQFLARNISFSAKEI